jgi:hypothetical protein
MDHQRALGLLTRNRYKLSSIDGYDLVEYLNSLVRAEIQREKPLSLSDVYQLDPRQYVYTTYFDLARGQWSYPSLYPVSYIRSLHPSVISQYLWCFWYAETPPTLPILQREQQRVYVDYQTYLRRARRVYDSTPQPSIYNIPKSITNGWYAGSRDSQRVYQ